MRIFEPLLINALILIILLLFIPLFAENYHKGLSEQMRGKLIIACSFFGIVFCILFPINVQNEFLLDLRWVSVLIGCVFSSFTGSVFLLSAMSVTRLAIGGFDLGAITTLVTSCITIFVLFILFKRNVLKSKSGRFISLFWLSLITTSLILIVEQLYISQQSLTFMLIYVFLSLLTILSLAYCLEYLHEMSLVYKSVIKAEKMEVVSQLAASISHEVRNPMTVVKGFLQLLEKHAFDDHAREYIKLSLQEIDRANEIIIGYLAFAKPAPEQTERLDIRVEIEKALSVIQPLAHLNNIRVFTELDSIYVTGVSHLLQQCLMNIFKNCIEAMPDQGTLFVSSKLDPNGSLCIQIVDTGAGMTREQVARMGEPYFTTKGRNGTGLGMMAVYRIIEIMGGAIHIESKINQGSTFRITFPVGE